MSELSEHDHMYMLEQTMIFLLCTNEVSSEKRKRDAINTSVSRAHAENAEED